MQQNLSEDMIGTYDENAIPEGLQFPLKLNGSNFSIDDDNNITLVSFDFGQENVKKLLDLRKVKFLIRILNGEIRMVQDENTLEWHVFIPKKAGEVLPSERENASVEGSVVQDVQKKKRGRGRPRKEKVNA